MLIQDVSNWSTYDVYDKEKQIITKVWYTMYVYKYTLYMLLLLLRMYI